MVGTIQNWVRILCIIGRDHIVLNRFEGSFFSCQGILFFLMFIFFISNLSYKYCTALSFECEIVGKLFPLWKRYYTMMGFSCTALLFECEIVGKLFLLWGKYYTMMGFSFHCF